MALYNTHLLALDRRARQRPGRLVGPVRQRLAGLFRSSPEAGLESATPPPLTHSARETRETVGDGAPRFALARRGYDCVAVDEYVGDLERELTALDRELAELRGAGRAEDDVATELKRLGEQTSAVLMAAHEQREHILRRAYEEADRCLADARATASAVTAHCEERLRDVKAQIDAAQAERARLLGELRAVSAALVAVADSAEGPTANRAQELATVSS